VSCIGTLILMGSPLEFLPFHHNDRFPRSAQKPGLSSCHLSTGCHPNSKQVASGLCPSVTKQTLVLTSSKRFRWVIEWFACAHLLNPHLIESCSTFSLTLTTMALYLCSLRWFETCPCRPVSRGLSLIFCAVLLAN